MKLASRRDWLAAPRGGRPGLPGGLVEESRQPVLVWAPRFGGGQRPGRRAFSPQRTVNDELVVTTGTRLFN